MYDVIIIGGGPAGITAGIYIKRAGFKVLIISKGEGALTRTEKIENYYGFETPISGKELIEKGEKQAKNLGIELIKKEVIGIKYTESGFEVMVANQSKADKYVAKTVVIATGVNRNKPNMKGLQEFEDDSSQKIDGVFIAQGTAGCLEFAKKLGAKTENNNIVVNDEMQTSIENIYACGDCTGGILQISKAVYEGTKAGLVIINKLRRKEN